jgi:serine protease Do
MKDYYDNEYEQDWDDQYYGTGNTKPPKERGGLVALMLILIIFLFGIIAVLGILNIRLFRELKLKRQETELSISFTTEVTAPPESIPVYLPEEASVYSESPAVSSIQITQTPQSRENIPAEGGLSLQDIYTKNIGSVVSIICQTRSGSNTGTGVVLSQQGYLVTNAHVVEDAQSVTVQLTDNRSFQASLVGSDEISDLAVLHIPAEDLIPAVFGDSSALRVGDTVTAIGDPLGVEFRGSFTDGIISAINRDVAVDGRTMNLIQTNAALNSGNSGGPLINCYGQVIGINTMKIGVFANTSGVEGLGFAIPSATVKDIVDQIINQGYVSGRPTLGISGDALSSFYQYYYRMPPGLYITKVDSGSYAAYYGIEEGDLLLSIDDHRITDMESLNTVLYNHQVGDIVTVVIYRGGQQYSVELTLIENTK